jgi:hypothetical protein
VAVLPAGHPFRRHSENLRAVKAGRKQAERAHKSAIRRADAAAIGFTARIHQLLIGLLAEAQLRVIVNDPDGFNDKERRLLMQERSQQDRWLRAVDFAIRRHYEILLHYEIDDVRTAPGVTAQYDSLIDILKNDLASVIQDRNNLAHAQWVWLLNGKESDFTGAAAEPFNYLALKRRGEVINETAGLIHVLAVSEPTFQRDYTRIYGEITALHATIDGIDYPIFVSELQSRRRD